EVLSAGIRFLSPVPFLFLQTPTGRVFEKQWRDMEYEPTLNEWAILEKYGAVKAFTEKKEFMFEHPGWSGLRKGADYTTRILIGLSFAYVMNHFYQMSQNMVSLDDFVTNPAYELRDDQVQLIIESVPFPHLALRIGEKIYS